MSQSPFSPVEKALEQLEKKHQAKLRRRRLWWSSVLLLLVCGTGSHWWPQETEAGLRPFKYRTSGAEELKYLLKNQETALLVSHPQLGQDTVRSLQDYQRFGQRIARYWDSLEQQRAEVLDVAPPLPVFSLRIEGRLQAQRSIRYTIEDYDPTVQYVLDLGNGQTRDIQQSTTYRYPLPGHFELRLLAYRGQDSSVFLKRYFIDSIAGR